MASESSSLRVLVLWADPHAANLGLRALAEGAANVVKSVASSDEVVVVHHSHNTPDSPLKLRRLLKEAVSLRGGSVRRYFSRFDLILDTGGGDSFADIYGLRRLILMSLVSHVATRSSSVIAMTPQTVGPFDSRLGRLIAKKVLRETDLVATRDPVSTTCAQSLGRVPEVQATDLVFSVRVPTATPRQETVALNVSGLLWKPNPHVDNLRYRQYVTEFIERTIEMQTELLLVAHVLDSGVSDTDVDVVNQLSQRYNREVQILIPTTLSEVRKQLSACSVVVGSRMHACLNALSVGTPAIGWSYSRKFDPLMSSIGWPHSVDLRSATRVVDDTLHLCERARRGDLSADVENAVRSAHTSLARFGAAVADHTDAIGHAGR